MSVFLQNLHAIRGLACVLVVITHVAIWERDYGVPRPLLGWVEWFGYAAVDLFFVLSGFVITYTQFEKLGRPQKFLSYCVARWWRVYPVYWLMLAIAIVQVHLVYPHSGSETFPNTTARWISWIALAPHAAVNPYVPPSWTLPFELLFYTLFAFAILLPRSLSAVILGGWVLTAVVLSGLGIEVKSVAFFDAALGPHVCEIAAGCVAAWLAKRGVLWCGHTFVVVGLIWSVAGVMILNPHSVPYFLSAQPWARVGVFGVAAVSIVYGLVVLEVRDRWTFPSWTKPFGDASYSIYLGHIPACSAVFGTTFWWWPQHMLPHIAWLITMLIAGIGFGLIFHCIVERPILALRPRRPKSVLPSNTTFQIHSARIRNTSSAEKSTGIAPATTGN